MDEVLDNSEFASNLSQRVNNTCNSDDSINGKKSTNTHLLDFIAI